MLNTIIKGLGMFFFINSHINQDWQFLALPLLLSARQQAPGENWPLDHFVSFGPIGVVDP